MVNEISNEEVIFVTGGYDHTIRFWTAYNGICQRIVQHPDSQVNALEITPDRHMLAAAGFQHIRMYEINSNNPNPVVNYEGVSKNVTAFGFHNEGKWMYSGGEDCNARIWDLRSRNLQCQKYYVTNSPINTVALHPNQVELYIGDQNGVIHVWNLQNDKEEKIHVDNDISIQNINIDPDGNYLAAVDNKGNLYTFALHRGNEKLQKRLKISAHKRYALKCKFSPDSTMLVTTSADQTAKIWRCADLISSFVDKNDNKNENDKQSTFVSGQTLTSSWVKVDSIRPTMELSDPNQRWVWDVAFSADSQFVITASSDNTARLWNSLTGDVKREYNGHQKAITALAFSDSTI